MHQVVMHVTTSLAMIGRYVSLYPFMVIPIKVYIIYKVSQKEGQKKKKPVFWRRVVAVGRMEVEQATTGWSILFYTWRTIQSHALSI